MIVCYGTDRDDRYHIFLLYQVCITCFSVYYILETRFVCLIDFFLLHSKNIVNVCITFHEFFLSLQMLWRIKN